MEKNNRSAWHLMIPLLLLADFYGYGFLFGSDILILNFFPILVFFVVAYCYHKTKSLYAITTTVVIVTIILILSLNASGYEGSSVAFTPIEGGADLKGFIETLFVNTQDLVVSRLEFATGGLYRGAVERNRFESLGVYFSNLRAADPRFFTDEPITVWGTIRSKTYKDAVIINFSCYRWTGDLTNSKKISADKIVPKTKFPIFTLEEVDTECTFLPSAKEGEELRQGVNTITFSAEYNFGTDAYLKTYFIDRDRFRAYARENIEPLTEFKIQDRNPIAIFTNGPVSIGIQTSDPLIKVSDAYIINPSIGITLTNRDETEVEEKGKRVITRWEGKIKNITELVLLVPPGIELPNIKACEAPKESAESLDCPCSMPFKEYDENDCSVSCSKHVRVPCYKVCKDSFKNENERIKCEKECVDTYNKCNEECNFLFSTQGEDFQGDYKGYALDVSSIEFRDLNKDIDRYDKHRSFQCRFSPSTSVLDTTPITTRYFRVRARYNYLLENTVSVNVEDSPVSKSTIQDSAYKAFTEANKYGVDIWKGYTNADLAMAIAYVESGLRHCCQLPYNPAGSCKPSSEKRCTKSSPRTRIIDSKTSIGIMGIRYDTPNAQEYANSKLSLCESGQDIYEIECNAKVGMAILMDKYNSYKNGCRKSSEYTSYQNIKKYCDTCKTVAQYGTDGKTAIRYDTYIGGEAAVRAYNGWGCDSRYDRDYVEKVRQALQGIKDGRIVYEISIKNLFGSRTGQGMVDDKGEDMNAEASSGIGPDFLGAFFNPADKSVLINWYYKGTEPTEIRSYKIESHSGNLIDFICERNADYKGNTYECIDKIGNINDMYLLTIYTKDGRTSIMSTTATP